MIRVTALLFVLLGWVGQSQELSVQNPAIPGIVLVGPQSAEFSGLVTEIVGQDRPDGLLACLPYGVVIINTSSQPLAAIDIVWTAGANTKAVLLNTPEQRFNLQSGLVNPGQSVLALPVGILQSPRNLRMFANGPSVVNRLQSFHTAQAIAFSIDGVVYASGQFIGSNAYSEYELWQAEINAPKSLANTVLQKKQTQTIGEIVS
jgi:hypothetical protein